MFPSNTSSKEKGEARRKRPGSMSAGASEVHMQRALVIETDASATMYCNTQGINNAGRRKRKDRVLGTELSLLLRGRMTLGVEEIFWFISHTLPQ
jgi:hypothetical protein